jgi:AcrR family transcriptional regulator
MGLRAKKVARTREDIIAAAIELFEVRGYEQTTMEAIAEAADIGTSTLYRYFSSKELILLGPFAPAGAFAEVVRSQPADEELFESLAHAIRYVVTETAANPQILRVRKLLDVNASPRARLWDLVAQQRALLEDAIGERTGLPSSDLRVALTARIALLVLELASDVWRGNSNEMSMSDVADEAMRQLSAMSMSFPAAPARPAAVA